MSLDTQVQILSIDTGHFYSNREAYLHWKKHKLSIEKNQLDYGYGKNDSNNKVRRIFGKREIIKELSKNEIDESAIKLIKKGEYDFNSYNGDADYILKLIDRYNKISDLINYKGKKIEEIKDELSLLLLNKVESNIKTNGKHHQRVLRNINPSNAKTAKDILKNEKDEFDDNKIISVFESSLTRMIGVVPDNLTEDFMVVQVYYFDIIKDLIYYGFTYKGEKYIYFTSSAGQIRTKKTVFIKESVWNKYEKTIMCGLTLDSINSKGGNNPNKHLAYMALTNSATDVWDEFDIDKSIVIDDFETNVYGTYDLVDDTDYSIKRISDYVPIPHTDGAGMMLPCMGNNRMVRLPWVKGLLGSFDYVRFIEENNCSPVIKDIYGKEHDIISEDIQVIFTKSQFKMWKYYDSWEQYKEFYKQYNCSVGYTNLEEDKIKNATINYQMLQSLTDITDDEINLIIRESQEKLNNICTLDGMKDAYGITPYNDNMTYLQQAINLYPTLLNDEYIKANLREIKNSLIKRYKAGSLSVRGKYTFLLPDLYAACEHWFMDVENPKGLLNDKEVFCWLFRKDDKLDCLRSPHLYKEHAIRKNTACIYDKDKKGKHIVNDEKKKRQELIRKWFTTDAVYTSSHDLISKILQFDVDGDKSLVLADENIINVAERNMNGIVPLYYNMKKASPIELNSEHICDGLQAAFKGNIGIYSNNISKIWNSDIFINGTDEEKQEATNFVKLLCMENNFEIDYAKTLYKPKRPKHINKKINSFTSEKLPHFFTYAKDKKEHQVKQSNDSFVNKLESKLINPRINTTNLKDKNGNKLGKIDYTKLVSNPDIECKVEFNKNGTINESKTDPMIVKYCELNKSYHFKVNKECVDLSNEVFVNTKVKQEIFFKRVANIVKGELSKFGYTNSEITDILVKFLYHVKPSKHKELLWFTYGYYILENLKKNFKPTTKIVQCIDCGEWFETGIKNSRSNRCKECYSEYRRRNKTETMASLRAKDV